MSIDRKEVLHIAGLAHLDFSDEEYDRFTRELNEILAYVAHLDEIDTTSIEPTAQVGDGSQRLRDDRVGGSIPTDDALENAPDAAAGLFRVPKVIG